MIFPMNKRRMPISADQKNEQPKSPPDAKSSAGSRMNPWSQRERSRNGYVLDDDLEAIEAFNSSVSDPNARIVSATPDQ